ncbi:MAG: hypothetical protein K9I99_01395, partial [Melioribacteraceae bacterium]|nr:hypothetical protein [Melioribacteraceae bacterium]
NGNHFIQMDIPNEVFLAYQNAMWGLSSDDFYVVGNGGNIAHYQNGYWKKIESRTDVDLTDIYGSDDGNYIWTCGWDYSGNPSIIISIQSNQSKTIWDGTASYSWKYSGKISSLWYDGQEFWSGGNKFFHHSPINGKGEDIVYEGVSNGWVGFEQKAFIFKIRGRGPNSIFIAGDEGIVWHYNGFSFRMYSEFYEDNGSRRFLGIDIKRNLVTMCGWIDGKAWIINSY